MAKEATAKVTFTLENAEEVLTLLRQLKSFVDGGGGSGSGGSVAGPSPAPGTATGSGTAAPPVGPAPVNPGTANVGGNAQAMPQNTPFVATAANSGGMFGTWNGSGFSNLMYDPIAQRFFDPSNGSYMLGGAGFGFGGPGGPGKPATPPPPPPGPMGQLGGILNAIGPASIIGAGSSIIAEQLSYQGRVNTNLGYQPMAGHVLSMLDTTLTAGGAAIGTVIAPGVGTIIGGAIGYGAAKIAGAVMGPQLELQDAQNVYSQIGVGGLPGKKDLIEALIGGNLQGKILNPKYIQELESEEGGSRALFKEQLNNYFGLRYSNSSIRRFGANPLKDNMAGSFDQMMNDLMAANLQTDPMGVMAAAMTQGNTRMLGKAQKALEAKIAIEDETGANSAEMSLAGSRFNRAARYGGSEGAKRASGAYLGKVAAQAALLRQEAARIGGEDPAKARQLMAQASQLEEEAGDQVADTIYASQVDEASARGARAVGQADRAFDTALYGGQSAGSLPWDQRAGAYRTQARELQRLMAERGERLSPAERMRMQEQIDELNFKADFEVPRQREGMVNQEKISTTGLENAQAMSREMPAILRGSAVDQTRQFELQADALGRVRATYEEILRTSRYLTMEQKIQYQTQIENLKVDEERARVTGIYAKNAAVRQTVETGNVETGVAPTISLIRGAGGAQGAAAQAELLGLTDSNIAASEAELAANIQAGMSPDSPQNQAIRSRIASMKIGRENQMRGLAIAPMSAQDRARRSDLSTEAAFYERGYGTFGDIRGNLLAQIEMVEKRMGELEANRTKIRSGKVAGVTWTDAMEADYTEAKNAAALEALGLSEQYNYGYDQRLISEAYNMSGMGRLGMTRFTRREAAAMGVFHRALGGSEEQTRKMREMYPAMTRAMGSGNPMNFADRAIAGGEGRASVEVLIRVQDGTGRIRDNDIQVVNQKTSQDMNVNVQAAKRASG